MAFPYLPREPHQAAPSVPEVQVETCQVVHQAAFPYLPAADMACLQVASLHCLAVEREKAFPGEGHRPCVEEGKACSGAFHQGPEASRLVEGTAVH